MPGVVPHPALVLGVNEFRDGEYAVLIVYGTSRLKPDQRPFDLTIMNAVNLCYAGLAQATRFDLDKFKWLPWTDEWFAIQDPQRHSSPVIGRLPQDEIEDLRRLMQLREAAKMPVPRW